MDKTPASVEARLWRQVEKTPQCWNWNGGLSTTGYGRIHVSKDATGKRFVAQVHRLAYELLVGPIPRGMVIDHLCRNRRCVNPAHMEPVTNRENVLRGQGSPAQYATRTHCVHGHPFAGNNLVVLKDGSRYCRECHRIACRRQYHAKYSATARRAASQLERATG